MLGKETLFNLFQRKFPFVRQLDSADCGIACLRMIGKFYGKHLSYNELKPFAKLTKQGITMESMQTIAEQLEFKALCVKLDLEKLGQVPLPAVILWKSNHFVVLYGMDNNKYVVADPSCGILRYTKQDFVRSWCGESTDIEKKGIAMLLEPKDNFLEKANNIPPNSNDALRLVSKQVKNFTSYFVILLCSLLLGSIVQLGFPFLTQAIVDYGVSFKDINFIVTVLFGLLFFYTSSIIIDFIRSRILIHVGSRINISMISDFLAKLMSLPNSYFESNVVGDLIQRIRDHKRIETFVTDSLVKSAFSIFNILILSIVLVFFSITIFIIFFVGTVIETVWVLSFLSRIRLYDNMNFQLMAEEHNKTYEILTGIQEIKLNNIEELKKRNWEKTQFELFNLNIRKLKLDQLQKGGQRFLNNLQVTFIIFGSAISVVHGELSLGTMMAIIFIQGQLTSTISILINSLSAAQFAKISLERLNDVHQEKSEEDDNHSKIECLSMDRNIYIKNLSFAYTSNSKNVLKSINLKIAEKKITAIVGPSGSGKTTLLKVILKLVKHQHGEVEVGPHNLQDFSNPFWRSCCGTVMQDSYIFSDSITQNIVLGNAVDQSRLAEAVHVANLNNFIEDLPFGLETRIGKDGIGISKGQTQRVLIARAVYKNPEYLLLDEATNSLDANNEHLIMKNLNDFFKNRTVIIVAHRLSTVKNADQIVVLDQGEVLELGNHKDLFETRGLYADLIKNQTD